MKKVKAIALKVFLTVALIWVTWFYGFKITPALFDQGSSSAFDLMIGLWIVLGVFWVLLIAYWRKSQSETPQ